MPAVQPAPAMQRRHSSASSSDAGSDHQGLNSSHTSQENIALIPTRMTKVATSKPAANPLQFVKVGPCDLSRHAQEQLKKVEEVKKVKPEKRDEAEDWQSNLDNWKCSRRKRQEHIIERVVEVKKLELEEHDRNRRRSKTFSEMLEERNTKGRKTSLPVYQDDENDFSDLGLSTTKSVEDDSVFHKEFTESESDCNGQTNGENGSLSNGHSKNEMRETSSEQEEYTYERAIQNYVNFTESRVLGKTQTKSQSENQKVANGFSKKSSPPVPAKPRRGSCKIEEKLSELEQIKKKSMSTNDLSESSKRPLSVPKVDILKRREMFEKSQEETSNAKNRLSGDMSKSIRERLSSLGKSTEDFQSNKKSKKISSDISVKDRLSNIEKFNSVDNTAPRSNGLSSENIPSSQTLKQRLSVLQNSTNSETKPVHSQPNKTKDLVKETPIKKIKDDKPKSSVKKTESNQKSCLNNLVPAASDILTIQNKDVTKEENLTDVEDTRENSLVSPVEDIYESKRQQHYRHRSLDSLDVDSTDGLGNDAFERVQSLEDLDFCRNYPASSVSGDTDREDSGIHTADVSSSVSQADDCDLHLDPAEFNQQPTILEEINKNIDSHTSTLMSKHMNKLNVSEALLELPVEVVPDVEVVENSSSFFKLPLRIDCDQLPIILESPSEPIPPIMISDISNPDTTIFPHEPSESSPVIHSSQTNVTSNFERGPNSVNQSSDVYKNSISDECNLKLVTGGGEKSVVNSLSVNITPNSLTTLPVELSSAEVLHDSKSGAMEICHKIDLSELTSSLPANATVEAQCTLEPHEKLTAGSVGGGASHQLTALTVDVSAKPDLTLPLLPSSTYTTDNSQVIENIETMFPLSPSMMEPPKEKPPPPPTEISDDDDTTCNNKSVSLRRLDSTKRIKKEIRQKRSSFLGIEGSLDDNYLEPELELVRRPPDISSFLAEEKRLEQLLYRQSICSESESRDSGVELEKHNDDLTWPTVHHSRDNSETYANTSTTSEEEEIVKKEREIIEILEREEINRYSSSSAQDKANIGEKLAERLRELEAEKSRLEWEREEEMSRRKAEELARVEHQSRIQARERELCKQETAQDVQEMDIDTELLLAERERLEAEQASLARQRDLMLQQQYHNRSLTDVRLAECYPDYHRRSMQDLRTEPATLTPQRRPAVDLPVPAVDNRRSMPDLSLQPRRPPPPIPPAKPLLIPRTQDKRISNPQQMSRQTLQALSAAPKTRLNDNWLQAKRKPNNYQQHWLIQEAEQRRIVEHHQRQAVGSINVGRRPVPPPPQPARSSGAGQYINWQPEKRQDKPLPDSIIQTLTQRVQNRLQTTHVPADTNNNRRRSEQSAGHIPVIMESQEKMLSVSGKKKCSHCGDELGRGAAMIIESLRLFYHIDCFKCCVCCVQLGDGLMGTDVRVRNNKLHCHNCYSSDDGVKFSCV